jgi:hypothetical protein
MGLINNPNTIKDGLILSVDAGSIRSFRGPARTNLAKGLDFSSGGSNTSTYKYSSGTEVVDIPRIGKRTVKYVDHWNDYAGGSGQCCPNLFYYTGGTSIPLSPSTTYTYSIIYKTTTGYTHPNFMYRYEYNSSGTYLTEGGVHSDSNRTNLGNGWYYAWGQFTTQSTTSYMTGYLFYYQYLTWDRIYVDRVSIVAGTTVPEPEQLTDYNSTNAGLWYDTSGNAYNGTPTNGPSYSSANGGSIVLDGSDDYIETTTSSGFGLGGTAVATMTFWLNATRKSGGGAQYQYIAGFRDDSDFDFFFLLLDSSGGSVLTEARLRTASGTYDINVEYVSYFGTWTHVTFVCDANKTELYLNGVLAGQNTSKTGNFGAGSSNFRIGVNGNSLNYYAKANIANLQIYNKALSATEIVQNFNASRNRFGV